MEHYTKYDLHEKIVATLTKHREEICLKRDTLTGFDSYNFCGKGQPHSYLLSKSVLMFWINKDETQAIVFTELEKEIVDNFLKNFEKEIWG